MSSSFELWQPPEWLKNATIWAIFLALSGLTIHNQYQQWPVHRINCAFQPTAPLFPEYRSTSETNRFDDSTKSSLKLLRNGRVDGTTSSSEGGSVDIFGSWDVEKNGKGVEIWNVDYSVDRSDGSGLGDGFSFKIPTDLKSKSTFGYWTPDDVKASMYIDARCREVD